MHFNSLIQNDNSTKYISSLTRSVLVDEDAIDLIIRYIN